MRAVTWQGTESVSVEEVPDPRIEADTDAIIRVTSTAICGSDLHLYRVLGMFMDAGDVLGHEAMGVVEEVGSAVGRLRPGDRVVVPFNISCGYCGACRRGLMSQCETTQVRSQGTGAALFGYSKLYGQVPGGQAEYLRVPQAQFGPLIVPEEGADEQYLFLSDVVPTAWQAVQYADIPAGGSVAVWGLGPIGQMCTRIALIRGASQVFGIDRVFERLQMADRHGVHTIDRAAGNPVETLRDLTGGHGPDVVIDAVGMEAGGSPVAASAQRMVGLLPDRAATVLTERFGVDRLAVLHECINAVARGGTVSVTGVYGGQIDPMPMMVLFDKQLTMRFGQANVRRWTDDIFPLLTDEDPLGIHDLVTHRLPLAEAPAAYEMFQKKQDGCIKVVLTP